MPDIQDNTQPSTETQNDKQAIATPPDKVPTDKPKEEKPIQIKYPPFLWQQSQKFIKEIEEKLGLKILAYFTNPFASISNEDVEYFFSHVRELQPESSLGLILISNGGSPLAAWRIANVLRNYCKNLTLIVPSRCASAATLLALSAEKILFGPAGYLTAIDSSLNHPLNPRPEKGATPSISVDQINRVKEFINEDLKIHPNNKTLSEILFDKIHPVVFGELQRSSSLSKLVARNMINLKTNPPTDEEQFRIADILNDSYPTHAYPIVLKEAQQIGLPAESTPQDLNSPLWELAKLYSLISKKVITNFKPGFYHIEEIPVIIESIDKRTFFTISQDRRFLPQPGLGWVTENDKTRWLSSTPDPENPEKSKFSEIEL